MDKHEVISFFDRCAPNWDAEMIRSDEKINLILDYADVRRGVTVLDVACGTGILFSDYLKRDVAAVIGVDISSEMVQIAERKFPQENIKVICGDVEELDFAQRFDRIVVYNAFPHFSSPEQLIKKLSGLLNDDGMLTIAHGMSRKEIDARHKGKASKVSIGLIHEDDLAVIMGNYCDVTVKISNDEMYQVTGRKKKVK